MVNLVHFKEEKKMSNLITFHEDFNLTFGVEVEVTTTNITREELSSYLKEKNVEVTSTRSYTHEITKGYKVVTDSTVSGFEVVSPILKGEEGLKSMERMVDALKEHPNVSVDRHCGVHVHFGISEKDENGNWKESLPLEKIKNAINLYVKHEETICKTHAPSRRYNGRGFNVPVTQGYDTDWNGIIKQTQNLIRKVNKARNLNGVQRIFDYHSRTINMDSFFRQGTIEFRAHQGSTDSEKIRNWIVFLSRLFTAKKKASATFGPRFKKSQAWRFRSAFYKFIDKDKNLLKYYSQRAVDFGFDWAQNVTPSYSQTKDNQFLQDAGDTQLLAGIPPSQGGMSND